MYGIVTKKVDDYNYLHPVKTRYSAGCNLTGTLINCNRFYPLS